MGNLKPHLKGYEILCLPYYDEAVRLGYMERVVVAENEKLARREALRQLRYHDIENNRAYYGSVLLMGHAYGEKGIVSPLPLRMLDNAFKVMHVPDINIEFTTQSQEPPSEDSGQKSSSS